MRMESLLNQRLRWSPPDVVYTPIDVTSILYEAGPKRGLPVHFYARDEVLDLTGNAFDVVDELREDVTLRTPPESGYWVQWEGIWRRCRN